MTNFVIFSGEELKKLANDKIVAFPDAPGGRTLYLSEEAYEEYEKFIGSDDVIIRGAE